MGFYGSPCNSRNECSHFTVESLRFKLIVKTLSFALREIKLFKNCWLITTGKMIPPNTTLLKYDNPLLVTKNTDKKTPAVRKQHIAMLSDYA